ncbi:MAG: hypothetical protein LBE21_05155, partial [Pseudomonadales bacterium]|nr:hypothetical protein [Pseudomonadales bacterium]
MKNKYFLLVMKFLMLMLMFQPASSQEDLDYRFKYKNIGIRDFAPNYGPYYAGAAADIATYTGLTFYLSSNQTWLPPYSGDVAFEEADYGANGHIGLSEVYNLYHQPCV